MMTPFRRFCFFLLIVSTLLVGCGTPLEGAAPAARAASVSDATALTIFAAASLTDVFTEMAAAFEAEQPGVEVLLNFAGSQSLRVQLEVGARADIFASANQEHMEALRAAGLVDGPAIFAHNRLVVIVPAANPAAINSLADLARPDLKLILAGPTVPVGHYARQVLGHLNHKPDLGSDFSTDVLANLVSEEENVKEVLAKVRLGEADGGIVYASDVTPAVANDLEVIEIPPAYNIIADYPLAVVSDSPRPDLARQFIAFTLSEQGRSILVKHGFQPHRPGSAP